MDFPLRFLNIPAPDILDGIDDIIGWAAGCRGSITATNDAQAVAIVEGNGEKLARRRERALAIDQEVLVLSFLRDVRGDAQFPATVIDCGENLTPGLARQDTPGVQPRLRTRTLVS